MPGGLRDTLDQLRKVLAGLANTTGGSGTTATASNLVGMGMAGLGTAAASATAGGARIGLAAAQALANQVQQTMNATAAGFASSMAQAQKVWRASVSAAQGSWATAVGTTQATASRVWNARGSAVAIAQALGSSAAGAFAALQSTRVPLPAVVRQWWQHHAQFRGQASVAQFSRWATRRGRRFRRGAARFTRQSRRQAMLARRAFAGAGSVVGGIARGAGMAGRAAGLGAAAGAIGLAGGALTAVGTLAAIGSGIASAGAAIGAVAHLMKEHAEHKVFENRHLSRYNAGIANAYMALDAGDMFRDVDKARRTGGTTAALAASVNTMRDNWQEANVFFQEISNRIGIMGASFVGEVGKALIPGFKAGNNVLQAIDPNGSVSGGAAAGLAAGLMSLLTDPANFNPLNMMGPARKAAKDAADAATQRLLHPPAVVNPGGQLLHNLAAPPGGGRIMKRPTPKW